MSLYDHLPEETSEQRNERLSSRPCADKYCASTVGRRGHWALGLCNVCYRRELVRHPELAHVIPPRLCELNPPRTCDVCGNTGRDMWSNVDGSRRDFPGAEESHGPRNPCGCLRINLYTGQFNRPVACGSVSKESDCWMLLYDEGWRQPTQDQWDELERLIGTHGTAPEGHTPKSDMRMIPHSDN